MSSLPKFTMPFEVMTIEHLGLRLYSTLPPVISELVSNAFDAESTKVEISLPIGPIKASSVVIVRDYGHGLTPSEIQDQYLPIGRNRRGEDSAQVMSRNGKVRVTGRKGLGKLSALGIATEMEVRSIAAGQAVCLRVNYEAMKKWAATHPPAQPFEPEVVEARSGPTSDAEGLEVTLRGLHRKSPIDADDVRQGLARRLTLISSGFEAFVNGKRIGADDRVQKKECAPDQSWEVRETPLGEELGAGMKVVGWIGFLTTSSQSGRGVDIFANKKAVELGSYFNLSTTHAQFARAYLVGRIHADFLDASKDLASTARNSVVWESEAGAALQAWGEETLKWAFGQWKSARRAKKEKEITKAAGFDKWLAERQPSEQRAAQRMLDILVEDENLDPDSTIPLLEIIKSSVESVAFRDLVDSIEHEGKTHAATLLRLFDEWRIIEAREHLKLADGRVAAMDQLERYIDEGALEVQQIQPLFEQHPWLLNPAWADVDGQNTYTKMLRDNFPEPKDYDDVDRRLDIVGITAGGVLTVVELKRPEKTLSRKDLEQIERYVDWARTQFLGTGPHSVKDVVGLLIVGKLSKTGDVQLAMSRAKKDRIEVETYRDLYTRAREYYGHVDQLLRKVAPEYSRRNRKKSA